ncbi:MAG: DUF5916 domain-containing protein [Bacteroidota bacterium]|nr:DUF5916 domain-containing protein [Bacteroidota bacterium]
MRLFFSIILIFIAAGLFSQEKTKTLFAKRISKAPEIDAKLDDFCWENADIAKDFYQVEPLNGAKATFDTHVKIVYDDDAIYIGAFMLDEEPEEILTELSPRDDIPMVDHFGVYFDPFNDNQNAYGFFVTAAGVQVDMKANTYGNEDDSWDAVWESKTRISDKGWIAEFKIPYSALRFPKNSKGTWGFNINRNIKRLRENTSWNFVDTEISGFLTQQGQLLGIENIKPPMRLSFFPYASGRIEKAAGEKSWDYFNNYGMDLKYGINESFTLDVTLIPDFGHVQSDDRVVNFSPFEIYYNERRPFFTEGTELFEKNGVFYSRRIGDEPDGYEEIEKEYDEEDILENPTETQLINATKLSGKTSGGLGIGIFNAMTATTHAKVRDSLGNEKHIITQPFTNYNMLVFDQALKNNSFVSFYNTNVYKGTNEMIANVSGIDGRIRDKNNKYQARGFLNISQDYHPDSASELGYKYYFSLARISGKFRYNYWQNVESETYDPNELGFLSNNNEFAHGLNFSYHIFDPVGKILNAVSSLSFSYRSLYLPRSFTSFNMEIDNRTTFVNYLTVGGEFGINPVKAYDYFEPRVEGWRLAQPSNYWFDFFVSPDYRKAFVFDVNGGLWRSKKYDQFDYWYSIRPRYRINDHLSLNHRFNFNDKRNDIGYVTDSLNAGEEAIIIGSRNIRTITNVLQLNYIFTDKSSFSFRMRHYWLRAQYNEYFKLQKDGGLSPSEYTASNDFIFNAFNIDMVFTWNFAPGSELLLVWKNAVYADEQDTARNYFDSFRYTIDSPASNSFTIKLMYYLDYQYLRKLF